MSLTANEWEIMTQNSNAIKLKFAEDFRRLASEEYLMDTSKRKRLLDKKELDKQIREMRHPLVLISKLSRDDFSIKLQQSLIEVDPSNFGSPQSRFSLKQKLAKLKVRVLEAYRKDSGSFDVPKFAREMK